MKFLILNHFQLPTPEEMFPAKLPFSYRFPQELMVQSRIIIRGYVPKDARKFYVTLLRDAPEENKWSRWIFFNFLDFFSWTDCCQADCGCSGAYHQFG